MKSSEVRLVEVEVTCVRQAARRPLTASQGKQTLTKNVAKTKNLDQKEGKYARSFTGVGRFYYDKRS